MSRIFDALRQSAQQDSRDAPTNPPESASTERSSPLVSVIPQQRFEVLETLHCRVRLEDRLVSCSQNHNLGAEKFRFLRHRLHQLRQDRSLSKVLVTSLIPKEGKTVVAINLAIILARSSPRVLLIDADMRQPGVHCALGLKSMPGLAEFLDGKLDQGSCIRKVDPLAIYYIPAGHASTNPFELVQSPRMTELLKLASPAFDWIIFDSPPLVPFADSHCLATLTHTVLLVVRAGVTPKKILQQGLAALDGAPVAGVVLNGSDNARQDSYYYDYYPDSLESDTFPPSKPQK